MLNILKNKKIIILILVELLLLFVGIVGLFQKKGVVVDTTQTEKLLTKGISLPAGAYKATIWYKTDNDINKAINFTVDDIVKYKKLLTNPTNLLKGNNIDTCHFYLTSSTDSLKAQIINSGDESLVIEDIQIEFTNAGSRIFIFWVVLFSFIINGLIYISLRYQNGFMNNEQLLVVLGISGLTIIASLPCFVDYVVTGADFIYHFLRIEAFANQILNGEITQRISSFWLAEHGYASSIFYCDTFLLIPALLRVMGMDITMAYRLFIITVNLATAWIAYYSFSRCIRNKIIGMFGSTLYTLAPYRIYNIYNRSAVGEFTAFIFFPLIILGFYKIFTEDVDKKGYCLNWIYLVIGFSGIIQSHVLSCEMIAIFVIILCLILCKKVFQKKIFFVLATTVFITFLINSWFIVPFFDMMLSDKYYFSNNANVLIQNRGVFLAHLFYTLQRAGSTSYFMDEGMLDGEPIGIGAALLVSMIFWIVVMYKIKKLTANEKEYLDRKAVKASKILMLFSAISFILSLNIFPLDELSKFSSIFAALIGTIQFPTRLTTITTISTVALACIACYLAMQLNWELVPAKYSILAICIVSILFGNYHVNSILFERESMLKVYSSENMGTTAILGAEYLPIGAEGTHFLTYHDPVCSDNTILKDYSKEGLCVEASVESDGGYLELPMLYYKGYVAKDIDTGEEFKIEKGNNIDVRIYFPSNYSGEIMCNYEGMWYWHIAEVISISTGCAIIIYFYIYKKRFIRR